MNEKRWVLLALTLLLTTTAAWAWLRTDPQLAKVQALRAQIDAEDLPREKRRELFGQMREEMEKLSPEVRKSLFADRRKEWQKRQQQQMREFFALPKDQQIAMLDKQIDRRGRGWGRGGPNGGPPGGGGPSANAQGQGGPGGFGGPGGGPRGGSGLDSMQRRKDYLDNTTPEFRAQMTEYRRMMQQRRTQRGV
ncbi:MAG: hypothetical protein HY288_10650 [Planctomycetia bacterium]|nr:hypothetical protein [Planctomycetia bacterium]